MSVREPAWQEDTRIAMRAANAAHTHVIRLMLIEGFQLPELQEMGTLARADRLWQRALELQKRDLHILEVNERILSSGHTASS